MDSFKDFIMKQSVKWFEQDQTQEMDLIEYESKKVIIDFFRLTIQYDKLMIQGSEDSFLDWVAELFRKKRLQKLRNMNSSTVQLIEESLADLKTNPALAKVPHWIRQDTLNRYTKTLQLHRFFEKAFKEFQGKIEFYLPQAVMRREN